jgi:hypothetical protein
MRDFGAGAATAAPTMTERATKVAENFMLIEEM